MDSQPVPNGGLEGGQPPSSGSEATLVGAPPPSNAGTPPLGYAGNPPGAAPPTGYPVYITVPLPGYAPPSGYGGGYQPAPYPPPTAYPPPTFQASGQMQGQVQLNVGDLGLKHTSKWALASLICAIAGLFSAGVLFLPAIIFGHLGLAEIKRDPALGGRGMAIAGLAISYTVTIAGLLITILIISVIAASSGHSGQTTFLSPPGWI